MSKFNLAEFEARITDDCISSGALAEFDTAVAVVRHERVLDQEGEALGVNSLILRGLQIEVRPVSD